MTSRCRLLGLILLALASAPALADIYAYIDEEGRGHFSDKQIDDRYKLFMKEQNPPRPEETIPVQAAPEPDATVAAKPPLVGTPLAKARKNYAAMVTRVAREQKLDAALIHAVITVESGYNAKAQSPQGATGLMQLMPETARQYGVSNIWDPLENIRGGARYLRALLGMFNNNLQLAIAAYNAGEGSVKKAGWAIPNFPETKAYVPRVLDFYDQYRQRARSRTAS